MFSKSSWKMHMSSALTDQPPLGLRSALPELLLELVWAQANPHHCHTSHGPVGWDFDISYPFHTVAIENVVDHADRISPVSYPEIDIHLLHGIHEGTVIEAGAGNRLVYEGLTHRGNR